MMKTKMKQKRSLHSVGSLQNWLMGNNSSLPEVGKGATELSWSDRHAYEVIWVSEDRTECKIQRYKAERIDEYGMSEHQEYEYKELVGEPIHLVWRTTCGGAWFRKINEIRFVPKWIKEVHEPTGNFSYFKSLSQEEFDFIYPSDEDSKPSRVPMNVLKGVTKSYVKYIKYNIIFGIKEEYYDYSF